jgi:carboxymethylenebutenolidase
MASRTLDIGKDEDKQYTGYLSIPPSGSGPGLLLLEEVYGVNADIRKIADHYAAAGYVVLAPDLFWRKDRDIEWAYEDRAKAAAVIGELGGPDKIIHEVAPAIKALRAVPEFDGSRLGIVGLGFGGVLAYAGAARGLFDVDAGVAFFPGRVDPLLATQISQPWQFHFGEHDAVVQPRNIDEVTRQAFASRDDVTVHSYPGVLHGFAVPGRKEYDPIAAREAVIRTLDFLARTVGWRAVLAGAQPVRQAAE